MRDDEWFSLAELTHRLGALVWVEAQLADLLREWSRIESHAPAAIAFATTGEHHRWHSEIVRECLPTSPALEADASVKPPTDGWERAVQVFASLTDPDATTTRLKAVANIVDPWLDREVGALMDLARPVSDAAMLRWLRFVTLDHLDDGRAIAALLAARSHEAVRFDDHVLLSEVDLS